MRKWLKATTVLALALVLVTTLVGCDDNGAKVTFADPGLEAAIREEINKPKGSIYPEDLEGLSYLNYSRRIYNIEDITTNLTGLEYCINLTELHLQFNQIADISPLSSLTKLTRLDLFGNQISDVSPLSDLTNLEWLDLGQNQLADLSPLSSLTNLTRLYLKSNQLADISPLSALTKLTYLQLGDNQISDISPLLSLTRLIEVHLKYNPLSAASVFTYIPQLKASGVLIIG